LNILSRFAGGEDVGQSGRSKRQQSASDYAEIRHSSKRVNLLAFGWRGERSENFGLASHCIR
jgi:hypothetical protein